MIPSPISPIPPYPGQSVSTSQTPLQPSLDSPPVSRVSTIQRTPAHEHLSRTVDSIVGPPPSIIPQLLYL